MILINFIKKMKKIKIKRKKNKKEKKSKIINRIIGYRFNWVIL